MKNYPKHVLFAVNVSGIMFLDVMSKVRFRRSFLGGLDCCDHFLTLLIFLRKELCIGK